MNTIDAKAKLAALANAARGITDDEYGSERQIEAQNAFCVAASQLMTAKQNDAWDRYCMKASPDDIIDEALRILA